MCDSAGRGKILCRNELARPVPLTPAAISVMFPFFSRADGPPAGHGHGPRGTLASPMEGQEVDGTGLARKLWGGWDWEAVLFPVEVSCLFLPTACFFSFKKFTPGLRVWSWGCHSPPCCSGEHSQGPGEDTRTRGPQDRTVPPGLAGPVVAAAGSPDPLGSTRENQGSWGC